MILRIYFSAAWHDNSSTCPWALCNEAGLALKAGNSTLSSLPKADDYIAIISPDRVTCVNVAMPSQSRRRWETALAFVAEEFTLTDPEENHVVPGQIQKNGQRSLFIADKLWLQTISSACQESNITLRQMIPEMLLPALSAESWTIVWDGYSGFMRTDTATGIALDQGDAQHSPLALTLSLNAAQPKLPKHIEMRFTLDANQLALPQWLNCPVRLTLGEPWDWRVVQIPGNAVNLLWGSLKPKTKFLEWLPKLLPAIYILLAVIFIETTGTNIEWALLNHRKAHLTQEIVNTFHRTFGEDSIVVNPPLQMQRNIAALRHGAGLPDDADFLSLLDQSSVSLALLPIASITALHYESGRIDVDIKLSGEAALFALLQHLQSEGLSTRQGDIHKTKDGIETRLTIQPGGVL